MGNQDLNGWDIAGVTTLESMFTFAYYFNRSLPSWNTKNVKDLKYTFKGATNFNRDLDGWDVSKVTTMQGAFSYDGVYTPKFNSSLSSWDVSRASSLESMFNGAESFNQCLSLWASKAKPSVSLENIFKDSGCTNQNPLVDAGPWCQSVQQGCNADGGPPRPTPKPIAPPTPKPSAPPTLKPTPPKPTLRPTVACPDNQAVDTDSQCQFWDIVRGHCEDTTDDVKEKMKACQKTCGVCVTRELSPAPSAAPSAACTNTKQGNFKLKGSKQKRRAISGHRKVNVIKRLLTKTEVDEFMWYALSLAVCVACAMSSRVCYK